MIIMFLILHLTSGRDLRGCDSSKKDILHVSVKIISSKRISKEKSHELAISGAHEFEANLVLAFLQFRFSSNIRL